MRQFKNLDNEMEVKKYSKNSVNSRKLVVFFIMTCASLGMWGQTMPWKKIVPWEMLKNEAIKGDKDSQYFVGKIYLEGSDVYFANSPGRLDTTIHVNTEQAVYWLRKSAEQGVAGAEFELGNCYSLGEGVSENNEQALYWFRRAATQEHSLAQANLGVYYQQGYGVEKDGNTALYWYEKAAKNKDKTLGKNESAIKQTIKDLKMEGYSSSRAKIN